MSYQYTLKVQIRNATPYFISTYDNIDSVLYLLQEKIKKDKHYRRPYFVYNNFYNNEYDESIAVSRYSIFIRSCSDWEEYKDLNYFIKKC